MNKPSDAAMRLIDQMHEVETCGEAALLVDAHTEAAVADYKRVLGECEACLKSAPRCIAAAFEEGRDFAHDIPNNDAEEIQEKWLEQINSVMAAIAELKDKGV